MAIPNDPFILFSWINTQLRDKYPSLESLCDDMNEDIDKITDKLKAAGFEYDRDRNCFR
ncbi:MAG: DUF4250 domain-containing protein [Oscillospiraceae bacterium]|nr:DUF4250 domain-containing protein [Oscillospiraceae bacterium]